MLSKLIKTATAIVAAPVVIVGATVKATGKAVEKIAEELTNEE